MPSGLAQRVWTTSDRGDHGPRPRPTNAHTGHAVCGPRAGDDMIAGSDVVSTDLSARGLGSHEQTGRDLTVDPAPRRLGAPR